MKVSDVATVLNISPSKAYRLVGNKEIAYVRIGRSVRVRPEDLEAFIQVHLIKAN